MAKAGTKKAKTKIEIVKHRDRRVNIPTEELRDFVADEEKSPKTVLYPRDPSLDPQLVWKGKDEQDSKPLAVPAVPIYIQEKIHPQALIEDLRQNSTADRAGEPQLEMFADFNGLPKDFDKRVDFYHWDQNWANRMILGDSLMVMTSLAEKEGLKGKVQMIFMDPPYGIKFGSNWQVSTRKRDVRDGKADDATRQPEQVKAFRDTWELGIHSFLNYLRDRFLVARDLITDSGSMFVQIGDANVHLVRSIMDEVFGADNFVSLITFKKTSGATGEHLAGTTDFILWYAKDSSRVKFRQCFRLREIGDEGGEAYTSIEEPDGRRRRLTQSEFENADSLDPAAKIFRLQIVTSQRQGRPAGPGSAMHFPVKFRGREFYPEGQRGWTATKEGMEHLVRADRIESSGSSINYVRYHSDFPAFPLSNLWEDTQTGSGLDKIYVVQTNTKVIERCVLMSTDPGDVVLDPTCGSGTTAFVAEQWARRWITCDTSRVALALARTRVIAAKFPYYFLADSPEGVQKKAEIAGVPPTAGKTDHNVKLGFVYKSIPHLKLKDIASNDEIDIIHQSWQHKLDYAHQQLNSLAKKSWEEWLVPRDADEAWPDAVKSAHSELWNLRGQRQKEIDASIARRADTELLYDQPYEDSKRIRVAGPFTVESLSPHRVIAAEEDQPEKQSTAAAGDQKANANFVPTILENLRKAGVQNTVKNERLKFDRLEPHSAVYIQAAGEYTENKKTKRVAVCIGPEYGTVGPELIKEAAKEAVLGIGFDLLIVCGFAFDPYIPEEAKRYGKLMVLTARMNPDLAMGEELLKKTGAGNLFMVFGEPDVAIKKQKDGNLVVQIKGVDVYDPTTGQIRTSSTDDIACWFIDTNYNGESFFVRHAYFTGADEPYEKLKKALRAEVDEAAWSSLYSTVSRPFPPPTANGKGQPKIAVKVINHYGDEVMKVYPV